MSRYDSFLPRSASACLTLLVFCFAVRGRAHHCGEPRLIVEVGRTVPYRILADVSESQASRYNLSINSDPNIATASPDNFSAFNYGEFLITGINPGTNSFVFEWFYDPNVAQGFCVVEVVVVPRGSQPQTAASQPQSGHAGDPVNTATGEFLLAEEPDLNLYGPLPLYFSRYYASGLQRSGVVHGSLGPNWLHNFDHRLLRSGNHIEVISDRGRAVGFDRMGGAWVLQGTGSPPFQLVEEGSLFIFGDPLAQRIYAFNAAGQLTSVEDGKGNAHALAYNGNVLTSVSDSLGRQLVFSYFGLQQLQSVSAGARNARFTYGFNEELLSVRNPVSNIVSYVYQNSPAGALLVARRQPLGSSHYTNAYDALGRMQTQRDAYGNLHSYAFLTNGTTVVTNPLSHLEQHVHNTNAQLVTVIDGAGRAIQMGYDGQGNRISVADREGGVTRIGYHFSGRPAAVTNADNTVVRYTYQPRTYRGIELPELARVDYPDGTFEGYARDGSGNILSLTNRHGGVWAYTYNNRGQVLTAQNPTGGTKVYSHHPDGSLASLVVDGTNTFQFDYDPLGRLVRESYPDGTRRTFARDALDCLTAMTNELGGVFAYSYNANGNQVSRTHPNGMVEQHAFDSMDRLASITGPSGVELAQTFDALGRTAEMVFGGDRTNRFTYDAVGNVIAATDGEGSVWQSAFDAEGIQTRSINPLGHTNLFESDTMGRLTASTSARGGTRRFSYDAGGRLAEITAADGLLTFQVHTNTVLASLTVGSNGLQNAFGYNRLGRETEMRDPSGSRWNQEFDSHGRRTAWIDPLLQRTEYLFDSRGRLSRAVFPGSLGDVRLEYDGLNAITRRLYSDGVDLQYRYDLKGELTNATGVTIQRNVSGLITNCNGIEISRSSQKRITALTYAPGKTVSYEYNRRDQVTKMTDWLGGVTTFAYDAAGRMTSIVHGNGLGTRIEYDDDNRISRIAHTNLGALAVARDAEGRVTQAVRDLPLAAPTLNTETTHTYDAAHRLNAAAYDALGRVTSEAGRSYRWDLASRLIEASEGGITNQYTYDGFGFRLSRRTGANVENFVWNYGMGMPSLLTVRNGAGTDQWYHLYTPGGQLVESINAVSGDRYYYHFDENGNTLWLTDQGGQIVARYLYGPYGELLAASEQVSNPFTFQGKYGVMREPNGLAYLRARYYDSRTSRFITRDPLRGTLPKAANPYQYALNNPLRYNDPLGLQAVDGQDPAAPAGDAATSAREAARSKAPTDPAGATDETSESTPPSSGVVYLTHEEWNSEVRATKRKLHDRVKKAEWGWIDPEIPGTFDSGFLKRQREQFYFRGLIMNGGELNYYFQGMYWKELGVPKEVMIGIIYAYKYGKYGRGPSVKDLYAACHGYEDNANSWTELRDEALHYGEVISSVPESIGEVVTETGSAIYNWASPYIPSFGE